MHCIDDLVQLHAYWAPLELNMNKDLELMITTKKILFYSLKLTILNTFE